VALTQRCAPDPGGSAAAWLGGVMGVPTDRIGQAHGIPAIHCGPPCVWAGMRGKAPWVWGDREVLDVMPKKGGGSAAARRR
jgi:hypothetical protein